jgi:hypothetical protein
MMLLKNLITIFTLIKRYNLLQIEHYNWSIQKSELIAKNRIGGFKNQYFDWIDASTLYKNVTFKSSYCLRRCNWKIKLVSKTKDQKIGLLPTFGFKCCFGLN